MDGFAAYQATAYSTRDQLIDRWNTTQQYLSSVSPKRVVRGDFTARITKSIKSVLSFFRIFDWKKYG